MFFVFSILLLLGYYFLSQSKNESDITRSLRYIILVMAVVFFANDFYVHAILPNDIAYFSNNGAGITFTGVNGSITKNTTIFTSTDSRLAYYIGMTQADTTFIELAKMAMFLSIPLIGLLYVYDYFMRHTMGGNEIKKDDNSQED